VANELSPARQRIIEYQTRFRRATQVWRLSYRVLLVVSALFSAAAAVVGKLDYFTFQGADDVASVLAGLAAVVTTLIAALDFEVNWRINQKSRREVDIIALEAEKSTADADRLLADLQRVVQRHDSAGRASEKSDQPRATSTDD
jgi:hypothetical protein